MGHGVYLLWAGGLCILGCLDEVDSVTSLKRSLYIRI
jgi:hypothetical protein